MTDAALDRELARALAVDPSPEFVARIRQRLGTEPALSGVEGPAASARRRRWIVAAGAALAAAAMVLIVISREAQRLSYPPQIHARVVSSVGRLATGGIGVSGVAGLSGPPHGPEAAAPHQHAAPAVHAAVGEPEILVDPREARAIRAFFEGVRSGRIDLAPLTALAPRVAEPQPISDIYIAPIVIDSLNEPSGTGGVRQ